MGCSICLRKKEGPYEQLEEPHHPEQESIVVATNPLSIPYAKSQGEPSQLSVPVSSASVSSTRELQEYHSQQIQYNKHDKAQESTRQNRSSEPESSSRNTSRHDLMVVGSSGLNSASRSSFSQLSGSVSHRKSRTT